MHWKQAMMQHKKSWRPEEWWRDARKRAHGDGRRAKADDRRWEEASGRSAASAYQLDTALREDAARALVAGRSAARSGWLAGVQ